MITDEFSKSISEDVNFFKGMTLAGSVQPCANGGNHKHLFCGLRDIQPDILNDGNSYLAFDNIEDAFLERGKKKIAEFAESGIVKPLIFPNNKLVFPKNQSAFSELENVLHDIGVIDISLGVDCNAKQDFEWIDKIATDLLMTEGLGAKRAFYDHMNGGWGIKDVEKQGLFSNEKTLCDVAAGLYDLANAMNDPDYVLTNFLIAKSLWMMVFGFGFDVRHGDVQVSEQFGHYFNDLMGMEIQFYSNFDSSERAVFKFSKPDDRRAEIKPLTFRNFWDEIFLPAYAQMKEQGYLRVDGLDRVLGILSNHTPDEYKPLHGAFDLMPNAPQL